MLGHPARARGAPLRGRGRQDRHGRGGRGERPVWLGRFGHHHHAGRSASALQRRCTEATRHALRQDPWRRPGPGRDRPRPQLVLLRSRGWCERVRREPALLRLEAEHELQPARVRLRPHRQDAVHHGCLRPHELPARGLRLQGQQGSFRPSVGAGQVHREQGLHAGRPSDADLDARGRGAAPARAHARGGPRDHKPQLRHRPGGGPCHAAGLSRRCGQRAQRGPASARGAQRGSDRAGGQGALRAIRRSVQRQRGLRELARGRVTGGGARTRPQRPRHDRPERRPSARSRRHQARCGGQPRRRLGRDASQGGGVEHGWDRAGAARRQRGGLGRLADLHEAAHHPALAFAGGLRIRRGC